MIKLTIEDDYNGTCSSITCSVPDIPCVKGYGRTKEEALNRYLKHLEQTREILYGVQNLLELKWYKEERM